jgi:hypothetical protein
MKFPGKVFVSGLRSQVAEFLDFHASSVSLADQAIIILIAKPVRGFSRLPSTQASSDT